MSGKAARVGAAAMFAAGVISIAWISSGEAAPPPHECGTLREAAVELGDWTAVVDMERLGCPDVPYDQLSPARLITDAPVGISAD